MHTVTNPGRSPLYATGITGADGQMRNFEIQPGDAVDVDERTAMILGEYGALVSRVELDEALVENLDPKVEPVVSPWSDHGPGTTERGHTVDPKAADAFADATSGDTSKTTRQVAALATTGGPIPVVPDASVETVSTGGTAGDGGDTGDADALRGAALEQALTERGLSTSGTADEKRARVAEYDAAR